MRLASEGSAGNDLGRHRHLERRHLIPMLHLPLMLAFNMPGTTLDDFRTISPIRDIAEAKLAGTGPIVRNIASRQASFRTIGAELAKKSYYNAAFCQLRPVGGRMGRYSTEILERGLGRRQESGL